MIHNLFVVLPRRRWSCSSTTTPILSLETKQNKNNMFDGNIDKKVLVVLGVLTGIPRWDEVAGSLQDSSQARIPSKRFGGFKRSHSIQTVCKPDRCSAPPCCLLALQARPIRLPGSGDAAPFGRCDWPGTRCEPSLRPYILAKMGKSPTL